MKKLFIICLIVLGMCSLAHGQNREAYSSGILTVDSVVYNGPCSVTAVTLNVPTGVTGYVYLADGSGSGESGTTKWYMIVPGVNTGEPSKTRDFVHPLAIAKRLYADVVGSGVSLIIEYIPR